MNDSFEEIWKILDYHLPPSRKMNPSGWVSFNAPCCTYRGHGRPDTRGRAGIKMSGDGTIGYSCFNCTMKAIWSPGSMLSKNMKDLMTYIGISKQKISEINFNCFKNRQFKNIDRNKVNEITLEKISTNFKKTVLPPGSEPFSHWFDMIERGEMEHESFLNVAEYIDSRGGGMIDGYEYFWTPLQKKLVIIPAYYRDNVVGYVTRNIDPDEKYRYIKKVPNNFIFNNQYLFEPTRKNVILVEGILDAIAIEGISCLGNNITNEQLYTINYTAKNIIVVPDLDKDGQKLIDFALEYGWWVSFPRDRWPNHFKIKDASDAVKHMGKLYTMWSIIKTRTNDKFEIKLKRKMITYV